VQVIVLRAEFSRLRDMSQRQAECEEDQQPWVWILSFEHDWFSLFRSTRKTFTTITDSGAVSHQCRQGPGGPGPSGGAALAVRTGSRSAPSSATLNGVAAPR